MIPPKGNALNDSMMPASDFLIHIYGISYSRRSQVLREMFLIGIIKGIFGRLDDGTLELALDPRMNKTGDIWHICIEVTLPYLSSLCLKWLALCICCM